MVSREANDAYTLKELVDGVASKSQVTHTAFTQGLEFLSYKQFHRSSVTQNEKHLSEPPL